MPSSASVRSDRSWRSAVGAGPKPVPAREGAPTRHGPGSGHQRERARGRERRACGAGSPRRATLTWERRRHLEVRSVECGRGRIGCGVVLRSVVSDPDRSERDAPRRPTRPRARDLGSPVRRRIGSMAVTRGDVALRLSTPLGTACGRAHRGSADAASYGWTNVGDLTELC